MKKLLLVILSFCTSLLPASAQEEKKWSFDLELYALATSIDGEASIGRATGKPLEVGFDDILENLELAGMIHFEAFREDTWGIILDYAFMDLGSDIEGPVGGITNVSVRQGVLEAFLARRVSRGDTVIDYYAGIRWWDNNMKVRLDPANLEPVSLFNISEDWIDLVVGARMVSSLNEKWDFVGHADLGGLGLSSDFTLAASAGFRYHMTKSFVLDLRYKALWVDYETGDIGNVGGFAYDTVTHGPLIGVIYKF